MNEQTALVANNNDPFEVKTAELIEQERLRAQWRLHWNNRIMNACGGEEVLNRRMLRRRALRALRRR